jgi:hypothetical protein
MNANVRAFWPGYLALIFFITQALPRVMLLLAHSPALVTGALPVFGIAAVLLRSRQAPAPDDSDDD